MIQALLTLNISSIDLAQHAYVRCASSNDVSAHLRVVPPTPNNAPPEIRSYSGECVRLKDFVVNANITGNTIQNCGIYDYEFLSNEKNGEGVYIGTSSTQVDSTCGSANLLASLSGYWHPVLERQCCFLYHH